MERRHRRETSAAQGEHASPLGLDSPPRLRIVRVRHQLLFADSHLQRQSALPRLGQHLLGLERLGLAGEIGYRFDPAEVLPEAAQGALALQVRAGEEELVGAADDAETRRRVEAERACVAAIGGGCLAPVAAFHDGETLTGLIAAEDGSWVERRSGTDPAAVAGELLAFVS